MAKDKKSFVLYSDLIHTVEKLPNSTAGELFKHILRYVNDLNPETDNFTIDVVFESIKQQLKRDLDKYEDKKKQWSEAGKASAEARKLKKEQEQRTLTDVKQRSTVSTVSVNDTVNVNDIVSVRIILSTHSEWRNLTKKNKKLGDKEFDRLIELFLPVLKPTNNDSEQQRHFVSWLKYQEYKIEEEIVPHWNESLVINVGKFKNQ